MGDTKRDRAYHEQGLVLLQQVGDKDGIAALLGNLGYDEMTLGNIEVAINHCSASLELYRELGSKDGIASMLATLGRAMLLAGRHDDARPLLGEGIVYADELGNQIYLVYFLHALATLATQASQWPRAARLFGACDALKQKVNFVLPGFSRGIDERARAIVIEHMGWELFVAGRDDGGEMMWPDLIDYATAFE